MGILDWMFGKKEAPKEESKNLPKENYPPPKILERTTPKFLEGTPISAPPVAEQVAKNSNNDMDVSKYIDADGDFNRDQMWEDIGITGMGTGEYKAKKRARETIKTTLAGFNRFPSISHEEMPDPTVRDTKNLYSMIHCAIQGIEKMAKTGNGVSDFYFERVWKLARRKKRYDLELWAVETLMYLSALYDKAHKGAFQATEEHLQRHYYAKAKARLPEVKEHLKKQQDALQGHIEDAPKKSAPKKPKLSEQCAAHNLPLETIELQWDAEKKLYLPSQERKVEFAVKYYLERQGYDVVVPYEGHPLMMLMQAACLPLLRTAGRDIDGDSFCARTFSVQMKLYKLDEQEVIRNILDCPEYAIEAGIKEILQNRSIARWFPGLLSKDIMALYTRMDRGLYHKIVAKFLDDPMENGVGWFDLTCFKGNNLSFVEAKTTDLLRDTQFSFVEGLGKPFGLDMRVIQVKKVKIQTVQT